MGSKSVPKAYEEALRDAIHYDPITGTLTNKLTKHVYGSENSGGYISLTLYISGKRVYFKGHRVAWFLMTGNWPDYVDHRNRRRSDNRWDNLREATSNQNQTNRKYPRVDGLPRGVYYIRDYQSKPYRAKICVNHRTIYLGSFTNPEEAQAAYLNGVDKYVGREWLPA